ncbi:MAG: hypothetical protein ACFE0P_08980 [Oceanicaulis sp.]
MLTLLFAAASLAQAEPADLRIELSGSGSWEVSCTVQRPQGERVVSERGRGLSHFETLRVSDAVSAACSVEAPERAQVLVRIAEADGFACPFDPASEIGDCQRTFVGPASETFDLQP